MLFCLVIKKVHFMQDKSIQQFTTVLKNDKVTFRAALRKYLNAHSFYTEMKFFIKIICNTVM